MSLSFQMVQKLTFSDGSLAQIFRWLKSSAYKAAHIFRALKILALALALPSPFPPQILAGAKMRLNEKSDQLWECMDIFGENFHWIGFGVMNNDEAVLFYTEWFSKKY